MLTTMKNYRQLKQQIELDYEQSTSVRDMRFHLLCILALESGARVSDLLRLSWEDIDTSHKVVSYLNSKSKRYQQQNVSDTFLQYLERYRESIATLRYNQKIFYNHYKNSTMSRVTANVRTKNQYGINFHQLRKYAAKNICNQKGVVLTSRFLGHARVSTTDIYLRTSQDEYLNQMKNTNI